MDRKKAKWARKKIDEIREKLTKFYATINLMEINKGKHDGIKNKSF